MIQEENNSIKFISRTFHWWPFSLTDEHFPGLWRGFVEQNNITLTDTNITVSYTKKEKGEFSLPIKDLEYCIREKRFLKIKLPGFSLGNTRVAIGIGEYGRSLNLPWRQPQLLTKDFTDTIEEEWNV